MSAEPRTTWDVSAVQERVGRALIDAFNARDPESFLVLFHPDIEFRSSHLVSSGEVYRGHAGMRRYIGQLIDSGADHWSRIRLMRAYDERRFIVFTEVLFDDTVASPGAVIVRLADDTTIIEATGYLSDEQTLDALGLTPPRDAPATV